MFSYLRMISPTVLDRTEICRGVALDIDHSEVSGVA